MEIVAGDLQSGVVGQPLSNALIARVVDSVGNPVKGQVVNFKVTLGGGSVFAGVGITNDSGVVQEHWTLGTSVADSQQVQARAVDANTGANLVFATYNATAIASSVAVLSKVAGDAQLAPIGVTETDSLVISAEDKYGNPTPQQPITWVISAGGGSASTSSVTDATGTARVLWTMGPSVGSATATATVTAPGTGQVIFSAEAIPAFLTWTAISSGVHGTCALSSAKAPYCWGNGPASAGLDRCSTNQQCNTRATARTGLPALDALSFGGSRYGCGLAGSAASCWGFAGPWLGLGVSTTGNDTSGTVAGGVQFTQVSTGPTYACGASTSSIGYCWGQPGAPLGPVAAGSLSQPRALSTTFAISRIVTEPTDDGSSLAHTCALSLTGSAYCWGENETGQLGDSAARACNYGDTPACSSSPMIVSGGLHFVDIGLGGNHTCGLTGAGAVYCWGDAEYTGGVAADTAYASSVAANGKCGIPCIPYPVRVQTSQVFTHLSVGFGASCALTATGDAYCWGANPFGGLGDGTTTPRATPVAVKGGLKFASISVGYSHTCGITTAGAAYCWGWNIYGQLGDATIKDRWAPTRVINR